MPDMGPECATKQLSRGESQGHHMHAPMADKQEDIIYSLTKEDVDDVAKQIGLSNLTDEHYRMAQKYFESFCDGPYSWFDAISDGLHDAEKELRGEYPDLKPEE